MGDDASLLDSRSGARSTFLALTAIKIPRAGLRAVSRLAEEAERGGEAGDADEVAAARMVPATCDL